MTLKNDNLQMIFYNSSVFEILDTAAVESRQNIIYCKQGNCESKEFGFSIFIVSESDSRVSYLLFLSSNVA